MHVTRVDSGRRIRVTRGLVEDETFEKKLLSIFDVFVPIETPSDITPPTAPGNLAAFASPESHVILRWAASTDDVGVHTPTCQAFVDRMYLSRCTAIACTVSRSFGRSNAVAKSKQKQSCRCFTGKFKAETVKLVKQKDRTMADLAMEQGDQARS